MATPTPSPAEPAAPAAPPAAPIALDPALGDPAAPPLRDSRMDFLPGGALDTRLDRSDDSLSAVNATLTVPSGGYSGIKVDDLEGGPTRVRGALSDGAPVGLLVLIALALGWLLWRFLFRSGRVNFAGQDGNR